MSEIWHPLSDYLNGRVTDKSMDSRDFDGNWSGRDGHRPWNRPANRSQVRRRNWRDSRPADWPYDWLYDWPHSWQDRDDCPFLHVTQAHPRGVPVFVRLFRARVQVLEPSQAEDFDTGVFIPALVRTWNGERAGMADACALEALVEQARQKAGAAACPVFDAETEAAAWPCPVCILRLELETSPELAECAGCTDLNEEPFEEDSVSLVFRLPAGITRAGLQLLFSAHTCAAPLRQFVTLVAHLCDDDDPAAIWKALDAVREDAAREAFYALFPGSPYCRMVIGLRDVTRAMIRSALAVFQSAPIAARALLLELQARGCQPSFTCAELALYISAVASGDTIVSIDPPIPSSVPPAVLPCCP